MSVSAIIIVLAALLYLCLSFLYSLFVINGIYLSKREPNLVEKIVLAPFNLAVWVISKKR